MRCLCKPADELPIRGAKLAGQPHVISQRRRRHLTVKDDNSTRIFQPT